MRLRVLGLLFGATFLVAFPTVIGLWRTENAIADQFAMYGFDGERYLLEPVGVDGNGSVAGGSSLELVSGWGVCCREAATSEATKAVGRWLVWAKGRGWDAQAHDLDVVPNGSGTTEETFRFVISDHDSFLDAWVLVDADQLFVTLIQPEVGRIMYRRQAFEAIWTGKLVEFRRPVREARDSP